MACSCGTCAEMTSLRKRSALEEAEGWVIAQVRGNNDVSDAKVQHIVVSLMETHFSLTPTKGNAHTRLVALSEHADAVGPRGRAVIAGLWMIRAQMKDGVDDFGAWSLITDANDFEARETEVMMKQAWAIEGAKAL